MGAPDALQAELSGRAVATAATRPSNPYRALAVEVVAAVVKDLTSPREKIYSDPDGARAWLYCESHRDVREWWCQRAGVHVLAVRKVVRRGSTG